jgi:eukaryotic-like serine/threonine-protein kinase
MAVLQPGTKLKHGTFEIVSLLGSGGFGEVYLGRQSRVERDVAIKVLHPHIGANADMVVRFQREAFSAANLAHPHVLTVFDFDFDDSTGAWFLAMQYVPGGRTLRDVLGPPRSVAETVYLIEGVAGALDAAHARGIVHRDVKPENVMLDGNRVLLTDFGIAHLSEMSGLTAVGLTIGTPAYMSPEQAMGHPVGARSDQYALAVMVYEMLAGRLPFQGEPVAQMVQHASVEPPPLETFNPEIVPSARAAVARALSKNPDDRYSSCTAFIDALRVAVLQSVSRGGTALPTQPAAPSREPAGATELPARSPDAPVAASDAPAAAAAPPAAPPLFTTPPKPATDPAPRVNQEAGVSSPPSPAPPAEAIPDAGRTVVRASEAPPAPPREDAPASEEPAPNDLFSPPTVMRPFPASPRGMVGPDAAEPSERPSEDVMPAASASPAASTSEEEIPPAARTILRAPVSQPEAEAAAPEVGDSGDMTRLRPSPVERGASGPVAPSDITIQRPSPVPNPYLQPSVPIASVPASAGASETARPAEVPPRDRSQAASVPEAPDMAPAPFPARQSARRTQPMLVGAGAAVLIGLIALVMVGRALLGPRDEPGREGQTPPVAQSSPGVSATLPTGAVVPDPSKATVRVTSSPDGASIMVNGEDRGRAPRPLTLDPGEYTITLVTPSYEDWTQQIRVSEGQETTVAANLTPLPALKALEIGQTRMGRDAYLDPAGTIRLQTVADTFTTADEINAIVYLKPKSYRIRDLTFQATTRWQVADDPMPLVLQADQPVSKDWEETFVRACAPAARIDPRGTNTPLKVEILIDGELVAQFTYRIGPGVSGARPSNPCDTSTLPSRVAFQMQAQG